MGLMNAIKQALGGGEMESGRRVRATWHGVVLAESDETVVVEGNHYFPTGSVDQSHLKPSSSHTTCPWKGRASYYDVVVDGEVNRDAAWYYPQPSAAASRIADHMAFWHGVRVEPVTETDGQHQ